MRLGFVLVGLVSIASTAVGADVEKLVIKCVDRQEASSDDIYVKIVVDGNEVAFGKNDQEGTSRKHVVKLTTGGELRLNKTTLSKLSFSTSVRVAIWEKDTGSPDETFGEVKITSGHSGTQTFSGGKGLRRWVYKVSWKATN